MKLNSNVLESLTSEQKENMQSWIEYFEKADEFAKTTVNNDSYLSMRVYYDSDNLPGFTPKGISNETLLNENVEDIIFSVNCGVQDTIIGGGEDGDMIFMFCIDYCAILTCYRSKVHYESKNFAKAVNKLLKIKDVKKIRQLPNMIDSDVALKSNRPFGSLSLKGRNQFDYVSTDDGSVILNHWRKIITRVMNRNARYLQNS